MKDKMKLGVLIFLVAMFVNCNKDEMNQSFAIDGSVKVNDVEYWPKNQQVMFGLFKDGQKQPVYSQELIKPVNSSINYQLLNIASGDYTLKLYIAENTVFKSELKNLGEIALESDLSIGLHDFTLNTYKRVQVQLLNSCSQCHGISNEIAAGLNLSEDESYIGLVNAEAKNSNKLRVKPFDVDASYLIQVLMKEELDFDHSASTMASSGDIEMVKDWIRKGALND